MAMVKDCGNIVHLLFTLLLVADSGVVDMMQNWSADCAGWRCQVCLIKYLSLSQEAGNAESEDTESEKPLLSWAKKCLFCGPWLQKAVCSTAHRDKALELAVWPQCKDRCGDMRTWISISIDTSISESMKSSFTLLELVSVQDFFWCGQNLQCCGWQDFFLWTTFEFLHWVQHQQQKQQWLTTARCLAAAGAGFAFAKIEKKI